MPKALQLVASVAPGGKANPEVVNPDGSQSKFTIPSGSAFVATDISIQRESVVATTDLFSVSITQSPGTAHQLRWAFVGTMSQNVERSFTTGIVLSKKFAIESDSPSADAVVVRLWGFMQKL